MENVLGMIAMVCGLLVTFMGLPIQIIKIWKRKSVNDLSLLMWSLALLNTISWLAYGLFRTKPDWFIVIPNVCGGIFFSIMILQIIYYRKIS